MGAGQLISNPKIRNFAHAEATQRRGLNDHIAFM